MKKGTQLPPRNTRRSLSSSRLWGVLGRKTESQQADANRVQEMAAAVTRVLPSREELDRSLLWPRVFSIVVAASVVALLAAVAMSWDAWKVRSRPFQVAHFRVNGALHSGVLAVQQATGFGEGSALLDVDVHTVADRVEQLPWVRHATVRIQMPDTLQIDVEEHVPVALLADAGLWLLDSDARAFKLLAPGESFALPVLNGLSVEHLHAPVLRMFGKDIIRKADRSLARTRALRLMDLAIAVANSRLGADFPVGELHWDPVLGVSVVSAADGAELRFGQRDLDDRERVLEAASRVLRAVQAKGETLRYALLDDALHPERVVVASDKHGGGPVGGPGSSPTPGAAAPDPATTNTPSAAQSSARPEVAATAAAKTP